MVRVGVHHARCGSAPARPPGRASPAARVGVEHHQLAAHVAQQCRGPDGRGSRRRASDVCGVRLEQHGQVALAGQERVERGRPAARRPGRSSPPTVHVGRSRTSSHSRCTSMSASSGTSMRTSVSVRPAQVRLAAVRSRVAGETKSRSKPGVWSWSAPTMTSSASPSKMASARGQGRAPPPALHDPRVARRRSASPGRSRCRRRCWSTSIQPTDVLASGRMKPSGTNPAGRGRTRAPRRASAPPRDSETRSARSPAAARSAPCQTQFSPSAAASASTSSRISHVTARPRYRPAWCAATARAGAPRPARSCRGARPRQIGNGIRRPASSTSRSSASAARRSRSPVASVGDRLGVAVAHPGGGLGRRRGPPARGTGRRHPLSVMAIPGTGW